MNVVLNLHNFGVFYMNCKFFLFLISLLCISDTSLLAQFSSVKAKLVGMNGEPLSTAQILLYTSKDTINYTEIVQSDSLGYFYLTSISPGEYILKLKMMGMKLKNIPLTIDTLNINLGIIMMEEDDKILDEVIVTEKYPEKEIMFKDQNRSRFVTRWGPDDPLSYIQTFQNVDATDGELGNYIGTWQWQSANGDTILTVKLFDVRISHTHIIDPNTDLQETLPVGAIRSNRSSFPSKKSYAPKIIRRYQNRLFGRFEYQIGDSVLFSNLHDKIRFSSNFLRKRHKSKAEKGVLIGLPRSSVSNHTVWLYWSHNPLGKNQAVITFSFQNEEKNIALWRMDVLKGIKSDRFVTKRALKCDFILPISVILHRIDNLVPINNVVISQIVEEFAVKLNISYLIKNRFVSENISKRFLSIGREEADSISSRQILEVIWIEMDKRKKRIALYAKNYADQQSNVLVEALFKKRHRKWVFETVTTKRVKWQE